MKEKISLNSRKSRIALILALILLVQIFMPIMKVNAAEYLVGSGTGALNQDYQIILYPGDIIVATTSNSFNGVKERTYVNGSVDTTTITNQRISSYTIPENSYYSAYDQTSNNDSLLLLKAYKITCNYNDEFNTKKDYILTTFPNYNKYQYMAPYGTINYPYLTNTTGLGLPTPTRAGYRFDGWYTAPTGGTIVTNSTEYTSRGNGNLYAHWTLVSALYTVKDNLTYNGNEQVGVTFNNATITAGTDRATNAGEYSVTLTPNSGYTWIGGTTEPREVTWSIAPAEVTIPTLSNTSKTYTGSEQAPTITGFDENTMTQTGTASETNAGNYTITWSLNNKNNYKWSDGTTEDKSANWSIAPAEVNIPTLSNTSKTYTGSEQAPTITGFDENTMTQTGTASTPNAGNYTITWSLKDKDNYKWSDGTTEDKSANWSIDTIDITDEMIEFKDNEVTYDGEEHSIIVEGELTGGTIEYSIDGQNFTEELPTYTDAGEYTIYYRAKKDNYNDKEGSNTLTINKKAVRELTIIIENQVYTGEEVKPTIIIKDGDRTIPSSEYEVEFSDNINPGEGKVIIKDKDGGNYTIETTNTTFVIIDPGTVEFIEPETPNYNNAKVTETPEEVIAKINLTEEDIDNIKHGKNIDVYLEVKDISDSISDSDKKAIEEKLGKDTLGLYLDVSLFKKVTGEEATKITEIKEPITISFELPDELINKNSKVERTYKVLRLHDGVVEELEVKVNGKTATFETDKFSTYAITYTDTEKTSSPKTGDNITMYVIMFIISLLGIRTLSVSNKRKSKRTRR